MANHDPETSDIERRDVIKALGATGTGYALLNQGTKSAAAGSGCSDPDPNQTWSDNAKIEDDKGKGEAIFLAMSVGSLGAVWDDVNNAWRHKMKQNSVSRSEDVDGSDRSALDEQRLMISQGTTQAIFSADDPCFVGARPVETDSFDYSLVANKVAKEAIAALSPYADYAITAGELIDTYMEAMPGNEGTEYEVDRNWSYGTNVYQEFSNYVYFEVLHDADDQETFTIISQVESYWDNFPEVRMSFNLYNGTNPEKSGIPTTTSEQGYTTTSDSTNHNWQIERIPPGKIRKANQNERISVSQESIERHRREGKPLYWAHNPHIELAEVETVEN